MSNREDIIPRRSWTPLSDNSLGGSPREEPLRDYGGWPCPRCKSTNTIIEGYSSGPEGYCMTCTRTIDIPKEHMDVYRRTHRSNVRQSQRTR